MTPLACGGLPAMIPYRRGGGRDGARRGGRGPWQGPYPAPKEWPAELQPDDRVIRMEFPCTANALAGWRELKEPSTTTNY